MTEEKKYRCGKCGWVGTEKEMETDFDVDGDGGIYSEYCCPNHGCWEWYLLLEDWEIVNED